MPFETQRLVADQLTCRRGERILFESLSFIVEGGAGLVLTGPNGVGKTSLLRILAGLLQPVTGFVRFDPAHDIPLPEQSSFIDVRDGLKGALTPREHVDFWMAMAGRLNAGQAGEGAVETLAAWRLGGLAALPSSWLSAGQRRRLALTRLALEARPVWMLDEPLNGLDDWAAATLKGLAERHMAAGGLVVAASHQPLGWTGVRTLTLAGSDAARSAASPAP